MRVLSQGEVEHGSEIVSCLELWLFVSLSQTNVCYHSTLGIRNKV